MMLPKDLKYTVEHLWIRTKGNLIKVGLTEFFHKKRGDSLFIELPAVNEKISSSGILTTVETINGVFHIHLPYYGEVLDITGDLEHSPELIEQDPYDRGWIAKVEIIEAETETEAELQVFDSATYEKLIL